MTNSEARQILIEYNEWRRTGKPYSAAGFEIHDAIDAAIVALGDSENLDLSIAYQSGYFDGKRSKSSIAQAIRYDAVNLTSTMSSIDHGILDTSQEWSERYWWKTLGDYSDTQEKDQARTFMLFVAEALES